MRHITVPDNWSADEALSSAEFLQRVVDAIWRAHGPAMLDRLAAPQPVHRPTLRQRFPLPARFPDVRPFDIPF